MLGMKEHLYHKWLSVHMIDSGDRHDKAHGVDF